MKTLLFIAFFSFFKLGDPLILEINQNIIKKRCSNKGVFKHFGYFWYFYLLIMACSFQGLAQSDSTFNSILGGTKTPYAFEKGLLLISPSIGVVKGTKNNFGLELEYGFHNKTGVAVSVGRSTLNEVPRYYDDTYWGTSVGIRHHTSYKQQTMMFDLMPGIYATHVFSGIDLNDKKEQFKRNNALGVGLDTRVFISPHLGFNVSTGVLLKKNTKIGFGFGLVFK